MLAHKKINKEFSISFILSIMSSVFGIVFSFLAAKFLESELYGEIQYYLSIVTILNSFLLFGTDNYIIKNYQFSKERKTFLSSIYLFIFALSSLVLPIYFRIAISFLNKINQNITVVLIIFIIALLTTFGTILYSFFQATNRFEMRVFFSSFLPHLLFLILFGVFFFTNSLALFVKLYLLFYGVIYGTAGLLFFVFNFRVVKFALNASDIISILFFGLSWVLYNITNPLANIIIGETYSSFGLVGIFALSTQILSISNLATSIVSNMTFTTFAKLSKENDINRVFKCYESITRITIYLAVPFYAAFIFECGNVFKFFGDSYTGHNIVLILLTISALIETITGPCGTVLLMSGKEKENFIASLIRMALFLGLTAILIKFTIYASPIALVVSTLMSNFVKLLFIKKSTKKTFVSMRIILPLLVVFIISGLCFFGLSFIKNTILWAITNSIVGLSLIIGFIFFTPFKNDKKFFTRNKEIFNE